MDLTANLAVAGTSSRPANRVVFAKPQADPKDTRVYDLAPLAHQDFDFTYKVGSGIEKLFMTAQACGVFGLLSLIHIENPRASGRLGAEHPIRRQFSLYSGQHPYKQSLCFGR